jgi:hypothetical protein
LHLLRLLAAVLSREERISGRAALIAASIVATPARRGSSNSQDQSARLDEAAGQEISQLLRELPQDVLAELNVGQIDVDDPAFLEGLADHLSRLALSNPRQGKLLLGKLVRLKKLIRRNVSARDPEAKTSETITRSQPRTGRNEPCPCGSGRKFKHCCLHT